MKELIIIIGFAKCGTTSLLYSLRDRNIIDIGKDTLPHGEIRDNIIDIIPTLNTRKENIFICKQPILIYQYKLLTQIKNLLDKYNINYKIIIQIRNHIDQLYSLYQMRVKRQHFNKDDTFDDFLNTQYMTYKSKISSVNLTNYESIDFIKYINKTINIFNSSKIYIISQEKMLTFNDSQVILKFLNINIEPNIMPKFFNNYEVNEIDYNLYNRLKKIYKYKWTELVTFIKSKNINFII